MRSNDDLQQQYYSFMSYNKQLKDLHSWALGEEMKDQSLYGTSYSVPVVFFNSINPKTLGNTVVGRTPSGKIIFPGGSMLGYVSPKVLYVDLKLVHQKNHCITAGLDKRTSYYWEEVFHARKIGAIKEIRSIYNLGLKEAKLIAERDLCIMGLAGQTPGSSHPDILGNQDIFEEVQKLTNGFMVGNNADTYIYQYIVNGNISYTAGSYIKPQTPAPQTPASNIFGSSSSIDRLKEQLESLKFAIDRLKEQLESLKLAKDHDKYLYEKEISNYRVDIQTKNEKVFKLENELIEVYQEYRNFMQSQLMNQPKNNLDINVWDIIKCSPKDSRECIIQAIKKSLLLYHPDNLYGRGEYLIKISNIITDKLIRLKKEVS